MRSIWAYAVERFPLRVFVPAIAVQAALAWWAAGASAMTLPASLALTTMLFALFRLWDDLEDVERDRATQPRRVLVRSDRSPFRALLLLLTVAAAGIFARTIEGAAAFGGLMVALWIAYRSLRPRLSDPAWRFGILLLKYPAFVGIVANTVGHATLSRIAAATVCSYLTASAYEAWHHDRESGTRGTLPRTRLHGAGAAR
jgi:hypothetical protein